MTLLRALLFPILFPTSLFGFTFLEPTSVGGADVPKAIPFSVGAALTSLPSDDFARPPTTADFSSIEVPSTVTEPVLLTLGPGSGPVSGADVDVGGSSETGAPTFQLNVVAGSSSVPEPGAGVFLAIAGVAWLSRRRRVV